VQVCRCDHQVGIEKHETVSKKEAKSRRVKDYDSGFPLLAM